MKYLLALIILIFVVGIYLFIKPKKMIYTSPDNEYELTVFNKNNPFQVSMPGSGGVKDNPIRLVLKNKNGETICDSNDYPNCNDVNMGNLSIDWMLGDKVVQYGIARFIHLETGEMMC